MHPINLSVVTNGENGNRLKLENIRQFFRVFNLCLGKNHQKILWFALTEISLIQCSFFTINYCAEHFVLE